MTWMMLTRATRVWAGAWAGWPPGAWAHSRLPRYTATPRVAAAATRPTFLFTVRFSFFESVGQTAPPPPGACLDRAPANPSPGAQRGPGCIRAGPAGQGPFRPG